jgi:Rha family phage regulatory protein
MSTDLFPETLLVSQEAGRIFTTSLKVAEHFGKKHKNVLRAIEQILADLTQPPFRRPNFGPASGLSFEPATYLDAQKKPRPMYLLTHDDFMLLAQGFTGIDALRWKLCFIQAFRDMERQIAAHREREASALYMLRPLLRPVIDGTLAGESRAVIGARLDRSPASITYHRRVARTLDLLGAQ